MKLADLGLLAIIQGHTNYSTGAAAVVGLGAFPVIAWLGSLGINAALARESRKKGSLDGILARLPAAEKATNRKAVKCLGAGAHGSAFLTNKGDVLKITISEPEVKFARTKLRGKAGQMVIPIIVPPKCLGDFGRNVWAYVRAESKNLPETRKTHKKPDDVLGIDPICQLDYGDSLPTWDRVTRNVAHDVRMFAKARKGLKRYKGLRADLQRAYLEKGCAFGDGIYDNFAKLGGKIVARDLHVFNLGDGPAALAWWEAQQKKKRRGRSR